jgi:hypothetical protein
VRLEKGVLMYMLLERMRVVLQRAKAATWFGSTIAVIACGATGDGESMESDQEFAQVSDAIGEASCATTPADATFTPTGRFSTLVGKNPGCSGASVVDILGYQPSPPPYLPILTYVMWYGTIPVKEAECLRSYLRADLYQKVEGTFSPIASDTIYASWQSSTCRLGVIWETSRLTAGNDYRIAAASNARNILKRPRGELRVVSAGVTTADPPPPPPPAN